MRKYFTRILTTEQVNKAIDMLNTVSDVKHPKVKTVQLLFDIKAPDGETVFSGAILQRGLFACRLHREVFNEGVSHV